MTIHFLCSFGYTCCAPASTTRREREKRTTRNPADVTCKRCLRMFAGEIYQETARLAKEIIEKLDREAQERAERDARDTRDAQLDAQERDTLQATASAKADRDAQISQLIDDEARQRQSVHVVENQLTSARRRLREAFEMRNLLGISQRRLVTLTANVETLETKERVEIAKLNAIRAQLVMLTPRGAYACRRPQDGRIVFVTVPA